MTSLACLHFLCVTHYDELYENMYIVELHMKIIITYENNNYI